MIVAALDFSAATPRVVEEAAGLARAVGGYVLLLHVTQLPQALPRYATEMASLAVAKRAIEAAADRRLAQIRDQLGQRGVAAQTLRLAGDPKRDIAEQAKRLAADYIVVGSHGHSALHDLVVGSTTSAVLKRSNRVVVVVPVPSREVSRAAPRARARRVSRAAGPRRGAQGNPASS